MNHQLNISLMTCIIKSDLNEVKSFVDKNVDLEYKFNYNRTALIIADENGYLEIAKYLIENGADIDVENRFDDTSISLANENGHLDIIEYLVKYSSKY